MLKVIQLQKNMIKQDLNYRKPRVVNLGTTTKLC